MKITHRLKRTFSPTEIEVFPPRTPVHLEDRRFHLLDEQGNHLNPYGKTANSVELIAVYDINMVEDLSIFEENL